MSSKKTNSRNEQRTAFYNSIRMLHNVQYFIRIGVYFGKHYSRMYFLLAFWCQSIFSRQTITHRFHKNSNGKQINLENITK